MLMNTNESQSLISCAVNSKILLISVRLKYFPVENTKQFVVCTTHHPSFPTKVVSPYNVKTLRENAHYKNM